MEEALPDFVNSQNQFGLKGWMREQVSIPDPRLQKNSISSYLNGTRHRTNGTFAILGQLQIFNSMFRGSPQPLEPSLFVFLDSPTAPQRQPPHQHANDTASFLTSESVLGSIVILARVAMGVIAAGSSHALTVGLTESSDPFRRDLEAVSRFDEVSVEVVLDA